MATSTPASGPTAGPPIEPVDWDQVRVLYCTPEVPEPDRQSGSRHLYQQVELLRDAGAFVTVVTSNLGSRQDRHRLEQLGVPVFSIADLPRLTSLARFDVALVAFWYLAEECIPLINGQGQSPRIPTIVDSIDLEFVRKGRENNLKSTGISAAGGTAPELGAQKKREVAAYADADLVLTVSEREASIVNELTNCSQRATCVPDWEEFPASAAPLEQRRGILFVGNFRHPPNGEALEFLCREILPQIDPDSLALHPVLVVGNALASEHLELCQRTPGVEPVGFVPSLLPYFDRARIFVAPLLNGAGTKRKLIQATMVGVPSVVTTIAAEGLEVVDGEGVLIADDPGVFAEQVDGLLRDADQWKRVAQRGRDRIVRSNGRDAVRVRLIQAFEQVLDGGRGVAAP